MRELSITLPMALANRRCDIRNINVIGRDFHSVERWYAGGIRNKREGETVEGFLFAGWMYVFMRTVSTVYILILILPYVLSPVLLFLKGF